MLCFIKIRDQYGLRAISGENMVHLLFPSGLFFIKDIRLCTPDKMSEYLGKFGRELYHLALGEDNRPVSPKRESKSVGAERTFQNDINDRLLLEEILIELTEKVYLRLETKALTPKTLSVKYRYSDFTTHTRNRSDSVGIKTKIQLQKMTLDILKQIDLRNLPLRLIGVSTQNFVSDEESIQLCFDFMN